MHGLVINHNPVFVRPCLSCRNVHGVLDFFGGQPVAAQRASAVEQFEINQHDAMFVVISDLWLDKPVVLTKLRKLFEGKSLACVRQWGILF